MLPRPPSHSPALGPGCAGPPLAQFQAATCDPPAGPSLQQPSCGAQAFIVEPSAAASLLGEARKHTEWVQLLAFLNTLGSMQSEEHIC